MKTLKKLGALIALFVLSFTGAFGQDITIWNLISPVESGARKVNLAQMRKALPYLKQGLAVPTNKVPVVARVVNFGEDPWINPQSLMSSGKDIALYNGFEYPKKTKDKALAPYTKAQGQCAATIIECVGDGWYPVQLNLLIAQAEVFTDAFTNMLFQPTGFYLETLTYPKDKEGFPLYDEDGELLKPRKKSYSSLKAVRKAKNSVMIDSFTMFAQFPDASINASLVPGANNQEKLQTAYGLVLDSRSQVGIYVAFLDSPGTIYETPLLDMGTFFWVTEEPLEPVNTEFYKVYSKQPAKYSFGGM